MHKSTTLHQICTCMQFVRLNISRCFQDCVLVITAFGTFLSCILVVLVRSHEIYPCNSSCLVRSNCQKCTFPVCCKLLVWSIQFCGESIQVSFAACNVTQYTVLLSGFLRSPVQHLQVRFKQCAVCVDPCLCLDLRGFFFPSSSGENKHTSHMFWLQF